MEDKKEKIKQEIEKLKKKMRQLEHAENSKIRKERNEKIFNTGAIFAMINPDLLLRKNTKTNPYTINENKIYRQLVGLVVTYNRLIKDMDHNQLQVLESTGSQYLNERNIDD